MILQQAKAATNIQKVLRGKKERIEAANERLKKEMKEQQKGRFDRQTNDQLNMKHDNKHKQWHNKY
jgi:hypothetical protein